MTGFMAHFHKSYSCRGFTIIEVIITTFIVALLAIALFNIYQGYYAVFAIQQARVGVNGSARETVDEFKQTVLQADRIVASHTFAGTAYTSGSTTTVFELPAIDGAGDIIASAYDYIAFYSTTTNAYKVTDGGIGSARKSGMRRLSDTLNALTFTYNNGTITSATSTEIDVRTQSIVRGQTVQAHVHDTARLRNI